MRIKCHIKGERLNNAPGTYVRQLTEPGTSHRYKIEAD